MTPDNLIIIATTVFFLLVIGIALTIYEFHYYILHDEDFTLTNKTKKSNKAKKNTATKPSKTKTSSKSKTK